MKKTITLCTCYFLLLSEVSVVFNISPSQGKTRLPNRPFLHEKFLISKYLSTLQTLFYSKSHVLEFYIKSFLQER